MTVIYNMSIDRADKPWIGDRRFTEMYSCQRRIEQNLAGSACSRRIRLQP